MASALSQFMAEFAGAPMDEKKQMPDYTTKRKRRAALKAIIQHLEYIKEAEEQYCNNIPENLQGSAAYENAEECVSLL